MKTPLAAALLAACLVAPAAAVAAPNPAEFVKTAIRDDNSQILLGRLAGTHGNTKGLRALGRTLVQDDTYARHQLVQLAQTLNVIPPAGPKARARREYRQLDPMNDKHFDRDLVAYELKAQKRSVQMFEAEARAGNGSASRLAAKQADALRKHLRMLEVLQRTGL